MSLKSHDDPPLSSEGKVTVSEDQVALGVVWMGFAKMYMPLFCVM